ncbi:MAG: hypothetical protein AAGG51_19105 [Cyanobacteria bacterium P01_G01_bin.54]
MTSPEQTWLGADHDAATAQLLEQLLTAEAVYPAPHAVMDEAWAQIETALPDAAWSDAEVQGGCDRFFATVRQCWPTADKSLVERLQAQFGATVPLAWLQTIGDRAQQLTQNANSPLEQLVDCVQPLLADWSIEDLQVFARPMAFAMRGASTPPEPDPQDWSALSRVEQARYTLQVARYALQVAQTESAER